MALLKGNHIGSVYIKVRPDTKDFREEVDRDLKKPLDVDATVTPELDTSELDAVEREIERTITKLEGKGFSVKVHHDHDSLNAAVKKIEDKLKDIEAVTIQVGTDKESLEEALKVFEALRDEHPVEISFTQDEAGYKKVLDKIAAIRAERTVKTIEFETDEASLTRMEQEMREALDSLTPPADPVRIMFGSDRDGIAQGISQVQAELDKLRLNQMDVELDEDSLIAARKQLEMLHEQASVRMKITQDEKGFQQVLDKIAAIRAERAMIEVTFDTDEESLKALEDRTVTAMMQYQTTVDPVAVARTEAILRLLGRDRWIELKPRIAKKTLAMLGGALSSLAGLNTVGDFMKALEDVIMNFDQVMFAAGRLSAVLGSAISVGTVGFGALLVTIRDIASSLQAVALAPALLLSASAGLMAWQSIWGGINAALMGIPGALEALPPHAQKAVKAIEDLQSATNEAVQDRFWGKMNDEVYRFIEQIAPTIVTVVGQVAYEYGRAISEMMTHADKLITSGQIQEFADNNAHLFHDLADAATPFFEAFMTLGIRGSKYLPIMGDAIQDAAEKFRDFINEADRLGKIDLWIRNGVNAFRDMGSVVKSTFGILGNLADIFEGLNVGGLRPMANGLREVEKFTQSAGFQSRMRTMFQGAKDGAAAAAQGFGDLVRVIYNADEVVGEVLRGSGDLAREMMSTFSSFLNQPILHEGTIEGLRGLTDFFRLAQPSAEALGRTFGRLGTIGAEVVRQIAPGLNITMQLLDRMLEILGPSMIRAVEPLTDIFEDLSVVASGPLLLVTHVAAGLLSAFSALPPVLQNVLMTLTLMSKFGAISAFTGLVGGLKVVDGQVQRVEGSLRRFHRSNQDYAKAHAAAWGTTATGVGRHWSTMRAGATRATRGIATAAKTMWAAVGGWPTMALTAVVGILSTIAGASADAKAKVEELSATYDQFTGKATHDTYTSVFKDLTEEMTQTEKASLGLTQSFDFNDVANRMGVDVGRMTQILADGGEAAEDLVGDLNHLTELKFDGWGGAELQAEAERIGFMGDVSQVTAIELRNFLKVVQDVAATAEASQSKVQHLATELGLIPGTLDQASPRFQTLAEALNAVHDASSSAEDRVRALKDAIDIFEGRDRSADELKKHAVDTIDAAMSELEAAAADKSFDLSKLFNKDGSFNKDSPEWSAIYDVFDQMETGHLAAMESINTQFRKGEISVSEYKEQFKDAYAEMQAAGATMADELEMEGTQREHFMKLWNEWVPDEKSLSVLWQGVPAEVMTEDLKRLHDAGMTITGTAYEAKLDGDANGVVTEFERAQGLGEMLDEAIYTAELAGDAAKVEAAHGAALDMGLMWDGQEYVSTLGADGQPTEVAIEYARVLGYTWDGQTWAATLDASGGKVDAAIAAARAQGLIFDEGVFTAELDAEDQPVASAVEAAKAWGLTWHGDRFIAELDSNGQPAAAAIAVAERNGLTWDSKTFTADVDANGKPSAAAIATAYALGYLWDGDKFVSIVDADESQAVAGARNAREAIATVKDKTVDVGADVFGLDALDSLKAKIEALKNRNVKINTEYSTSGTMGRKTMVADGGVFNSVTAAGLRFFQNAYGPKASAFKAFANGGFENHVAHITSPSTPIRIWSEPETHGEAYIPMSAAKRTRSLAIWQEVGRRFGVYADGGISAGTSAAGNAYTINVTRSGATGGDVAQAIDYYQRRARRV